MKRSRSNSCSQLPNKALQGTPEREPLGFTGMSIPATVLSDDGTIRPDCASCFGGVVFVPIDLTLSIDDRVVRKAKIYARNHHKSLSKVIEEYLSCVTENSAEWEDVTPTVQRLAETLEVVGSDDELKYQYLKEKYLDP